MGELMKRSAPVVRIKNIVTRGGTLVTRWGTMATTDVVYGRTFVARRGMLVTRWDNTECKYEASTRS